MEKSQTRTFPGLTNGEFSPSLVLTVGSDTAVLSLDLGPKALKLFGYIGLPATLKRLSKLSVKQLKRFIKFSRELQNFKQGYFMCIKWFVIDFFPCTQSQLMAPRSNMRRCIFCLHQNLPSNHLLLVQLYIYFSLHP